MILLKGDLKTHFAEVFETEDVLWFIGECVRTEREVCIYAVSN